MFGWLGDSGIYLLVDGVYFQFQNAATGTHQMLTSVTYIGGCMKSSGVTGNPEVDREIVDSSPRSFRKTLRQTHSDLVCMDSQRFLK
jgi:hypothetical protein